MVEINYIYLNIYKEKCLFYINFLYLNFYVYMGIKFIKFIYVYIYFFFYRIFNLNFNFYIIESFLLSF